MQAPRSARAAAIVRRQTVVVPYFRVPELFVLRFLLRHRTYKNGSAAPAAPNAASMIEGFSGESTQPPNADAIEVHRTTATKPETA